MRRKPVSSPHRNITHGGEPLCCFSEASVGVQQSNSVLTRWTTASSCFPEASKNISRDSLEGIGPLYCGGPAFPLPLAVCRAQEADLPMVSSLGLNWKSIWPNRGPGLSSDPSLDGSNSSRYACESLSAFSPPRPAAPPAAAAAAGLAAPAAPLAGAGTATVVTSCSFRQPSFETNPWWAISRVSMMTFGWSGLKEGPFHRTGTTS